MDEKTDWLLTMVVLAIVFMTWLWKRRIDREATSVQNDIKLAFDQIIFMRIEEYGGQLFAYDARNNEFICQGINKEELNKNFGRRFPERKGVIVEPDKKTA